MCVSCDETCLGCGGNDFDEEGYCFSCDYEECIICDDIFLVDELYPAPFCKACFPKSKGTERS